MENTHVITKERDGAGEYFRKVFRYKNLVFTFAKRDLKIKYAQTLFGVFWVLLQPLPSVIIFTFFFGRLINVDTGALPYPIFALTGMIGWTYFTNLAFGAGNSLIESQSILKKIYFPKLILPLAKVLSAGVDLLLSFVLIIGAMFFYKLHPGISILYFPLFLGLHILCGLTAGIWISALTYRYRDFQHFVPYIINFAIWLTPVFYPSTVLPPNLAYVMYFNPMAFVVEGYRFALVGGHGPSLQYLYSALPVLFLFAAGLWYFRRVEDEIADYI